MSQLSFVDVFDMARESAGGCCVTQDAEAGTREQQQLTEVIRDTRREAGELGREQVTLRVLEPVWLDSKTRHQRDNYRPGMVMEQWDAEKKTMTRHTIDRVAEATNSLVLQGEDGTRLTLKVTQLDGSWSLYRSRTLEVSEGDRVRALGRELKGAIKAKEQFTLAGLENGAVRLRSGDRELRLPTERAVKLTHDDVEGTGAGTSASRTVLAAVGPRGLNKQALNALAQSGSDIRIYTPLAPEQAARKVEVGADLSSAEHCTGYFPLHTPRSDDQSRGQGALYPLGQRPRLCGQQPVGGARPARSGSVRASTEYLRCHH